jgi:hypothetical protein
MTLLEDFIIWAMRVFRKPARLVSWEPSSVNSFRATLGFIDRNGVGGSKLGAEIIKARREMLSDRIMQTTFEMPVDQRPHFYSYKGGLEYRATALPADRSTLWAEGVKVDPDFENNRIRAGMRDDERTSP